MTMDSNIDYEVTIFGLSIKRTILATYVISGLYSFGFFITNSVMPYITTELSIDTVHYGYLQTLFAIVQLIGSPIYGQICDKLGIRFALNLAMVFTASGYLMTAVADSYGVLFVARLLGVFMHGQQGAQTCLAAATAPGTERTVAFSRHGITFGIGFVAGPLLGGILSRFFNVRAPIVVAVFGCIVSIFLIQKYIHVSRVADDPERNSKIDLKAIVRILRYPLVASLFAIKNLAVIPLFVMTSVMGLHLLEKHKVTYEQNAALGVWIGTCITLMNAVGIVWLRRQFSDLSLLRLGCYGLCAAYASMVWFGLYGEFYQLFFIMPLIPIGMTLIGVISDAMLTTAVSTSEHGTVLGLSHAASALVRVVSPTLAAYMLQNLGFESFGYMGIVSSMLALLLCTVTNFAVSDEASNRKRE